MTASCGDPEGLAVGGESQGRMHQELVFPTDSLSWPIQDKDKKRKEKKKSQATHSLTLPNCSLALVLHSLSLPYTDEELPHSSGTALSHSSGHACPSQPPHSFCDGFWQPNLTGQSSAKAQGPRPGKELLACSSQGSSGDMQTFAIASAYSNLSPVNNSTDILSVFDK